MFLIRIKLKCIYTYHYYCFFNRNRESIVKVDSDSIDSEVTYSCRLPTFYTVETANRYAIEAAFPDLRDVDHNRYCDFGGVNKISAMSAGTVNYRNFGGVKKSSRCRPQLSTTAISEELKISTISAATVNYRDFGGVKKLRDVGRNRQLSRFLRS